MCIQLAPNVVLQWNTVTSETKVTWSKIMPALVIFIPYALHRIIHYAATHPSIPAWRIPMDRGDWWTKGSQRVRHDWVTKHSTAQHVPGRAPHGKMRESREVGGVLPFSQQAPFRLLWNHIPRALPREAHLGLVRCCCEAPLLQPSWDGACKPCAATSHHSTCVLSPGWF